MSDAGESPIVLPDDPSFGPEVQVDYPGYRSTQWRAPKRPLVTLPEDQHDPSRARVRRGDGRAARPRPDAPARGRAARRADRRPRPRRSTRTGGRSATRLSRCGRRTPAAATTTSSTSIRRRSTPTSPARAAASPTTTAATASSRSSPARIRGGTTRTRGVPHTSTSRVFGRAVHAAARHADVLPRRPALRLRPDLQLGSRPEVARAARLRASTSRRRSRSGRSPTSGTSSSAAAPRARRRSRSTRDAAADAVADGRPLLRDRALPSRRERAGGPLRAGRDPSSPAASSTAKARRSATG